MLRIRTYKEHGSFNGCGFVTTLVCAIPTTLRLLLESKETKTYYPLWKTLTQTWGEGGRSQPSHREHMKKKKSHYNFQIHVGILTVSNHRQRSLRVCFNGSKVIYL